MEIRLVEGMMTALKQADRERGEKAAKEEFEARMKKQFDFNFYKSHKKKVKCMHKPTGLLQSKGPFRPMPNILLLYFKCEEGLRALLSMLEHHKKKLAVGGKVCRASIRRSIRIAREILDPLYKEETIIKVKISQLCSLRGESQLKVELVPVEPESKRKAQQGSEVEPAEGPVKVELQDVGGQRPVKLRLRATGTISSLDSKQSPVKVTLRDVGGARPVKLELHSDDSESLADTSEARAEKPAKVNVTGILDVQEPVKVKFHEDGLPVRLELLANPNFTYTTSKMKKHEESPVHEAETKTESKPQRPTSPVKVSMEEKPVGSVKVHLHPENDWIDDIEGTVGKPEMKKRRSKAGAESGEATTTSQVASGRQDWVAREDDYPRTKAYEKDEWVPREDEGLSVARRDSILWFDSEAECALRTSSTKVVWYPNEKYLEGREWSSLQTTSMKLLKRLRPTVDRPQFKLSPEVVNFRGVRLGTTAMQIVTLYNYQSDFSRFKISSQDACIRVLYEHGPLAAGMGRRLKLYLKGSTQGPFAGKVHVETEFDIFIVPVLAEVFQV